MSTHRLGNNRIVTSEYLGRLDGTVPLEIGEVVTKMLREMDRKKEVGDEILWDSLALTIEPERQKTTGLRFRTTVEVARDDFISGFHAMALASHEREKARRDTPAP